MSLNLTPYKNKIIFIPLGGTNEIGINLNLYYVHDPKDEKGKWIMVDCGSGFAEENLPGVDMIVADVSFVKHIKDDLLGVIITHAHEDHIGGVQYLWNQFECPIYATKFTSNFLKSRLEGYDFFSRMEFNEISPGGRFNLGPFDIEMTTLTHSAPEMQGLMIRTSAGNIFHTGDWKFDPDPIVGKVNDEASLKKFGDEGILALVCDSTNVFEAGSSGSEGELKKSITKIISECSNMVLVATFASNLARLDTLIRAGQETGRKVVLCGRSMHRMMQAAIDSGYLTDIAPIVDENEISSHKREELLVIATGCQGEELAATSRIASDDHRNVNLTKGDTIIFSSKIIPGNEKKLYRLFNKLVKSGIEVITEKDHFVHVSGHPGVEELKKMYDILRPQILIPVHGEAVHLHEHVKLGREHGIKLTLEMENGAVALVDSKEPKIIDKVDSGYMAVEGNSLLPHNSPIFRMRLRMSQSGVAVITVVMRRDGTLASKPSVSIPGLLDPFQDKNIIYSIKSDIMKIFTGKNSDNRQSQDKIETRIRSIIRRKLKDAINKSPPVIVNIEKAF